MERIDNLRDPYRVSLYFKAVEYFAEWRKIHPPDPGKLQCNKHYTDSEIAQAMADFVHEGNRKASL